VSRPAELRAWLGPALFDLAYAGALTFIRRGERLDTVVLSGLPLRDMSIALGHLRSCPAASQLRDLEVHVAEPMPMDHLARSPAASQLAPLLPASIERLAFAVSHRSSWTDLGDVSALFRSGLRELRIEGALATFQVATSELRTLQLRLSCPTQANVEAIARADWPTLTALDVEAKDDLQNVEAARDWAPALIGGMPRLQHLGVYGAGATLLLAQALHAAGRMARLRSLHLHPPGEEVDPETGLPFGDPALLQPVRALTGRPGPPLALSVRPHGIEADSFPSWRSGEHTSPDCGVELFSGWDGDAASAAWFRSVVPNVALAGEIVRRRQRLAPDALAAARNVVDQVASILAAGHALSDAASAERVVFLLCGDRWPPGSLIHAAIFAHLLATRRVTVEVLADDAGELVALPDPARDLPGLVLQLPCRRGGPPTAALAAARSRATAGSLILCFADLAGRPTAEASAAFAAEVGRWRGLPAELVMVGHLGPSDLADPRGPLVDACREAGIEVGNFTPRRFAERLDRSRSA
jgi:hypothetical protein